MFKCFQEFVGPSVGTDPIPGLYIPNDNNVKLTKDVRVCTSIELLKEQSNNLSGLGVDDVYMLSPG